MNKHRYNETSLFCHNCECQFYGGLEELKYVHIMDSEICLVCTLKDTQNQYLLSEVTTFRVGLCT